MNAEQILRHGADNLRATFWLKAFREPETTRKGPIVQRLLGQFDEVVAALLTEPNGPLKTERRPCTWCGSLVPKDTRHQIKSSPGTYRFCDEYCQHLWAGHRKKTPSRATDFFHSDFWLTNHDNDFKSDWQYHGYRAEDESHEWSDESYNWLVGDCENTA